MACVMYGYERTIPSVNDQHIVSRGANLACSGGGNERGRLIPAEASESAGPGLRDVFPGLRLGFFFFAAGDGG